MTARADEEAKDSRLREILLFEEGWGKARAKHEWPRMSGAIGKFRGANTLSGFSISLAEWEVKLLGEIISVFSPRAKLLLHRWESGPGGIRTRICDLDRVLCYRCTTGPEQVCVMALRMATE